MTTEEIILAAAGELLESGGPAAVTTRAVCNAANVTAPTLYHHFGDMDGLVNALVNGGITDFMAAKRANRNTEDPLADLRRGWDRWIEFALKRPALFRLMIERASRDPELGREAHAIMRATLERMHAKGLLAVDVDVAARAVQAASNGVLSLFAQGAMPADVKQTGALLFDAMLDRLVVRPGR
jgi:AcrR family transcriptional regulator